MRRFVICSVAALAIGILVAGLSCAQDDQAQRPGPAPVAGSEDFRSDNPLRESDVQTRSENRRPAPAAAMRLPAPGRSNGDPGQTDVRRYEGATDDRREYRSSEPARTQRGPAPIAAAPIDAAPTGGTAQGDPRYETASRMSPRPDSRYGEPAAGTPEQPGAMPAPFAGDPNPAISDRIPAQGRPHLLPEGNARLTDRPPSLNAPTAPRGSATAPRGSASAPRNYAANTASYHPGEEDAGSTGTATPGDPQLEGAQTPQLVLEKQAPEEIQIGKTAVFRTTVRNTGKIAAHEVEIHDLIPKGMRLVGTKPDAKQGIDGKIVWELGRLRPGDEQTVEAHFMPVAEGELGSVATVQFQAIASAKTRVTRPMLHLETKLPEAVLIGQQAQVSIIVSNPGTGVATGVVIEEIVPQGFEHEAGHHLEQEIGTLKPGESKTIDLTLKATQAGAAENRLTARADGGLFTEDNRPITVTSPALDIVLDGPGRRYLERETTYKVAISNPGTAPAQQVELVAYLPQGMKFLKADNAGHYDSRTRTVRWNLEELPAREAGEVALTAMPIEPGPQKLRVSGAARLVPPVEKEQPILIEGIAAIHFEVADLVDAIELGEETTYRVRVVNQGTKAATDVEVACELDVGMQFVTAEGPTAHRQSANTVSFEPLPQLGAKAETTYRVRVRGTRSGDQRMRVRLQTGQMQTPVTKEESTRVYSDE